jgi:predicted ATPase
MARQAICAIASANRRRSSRCCAGCGTAISSAASLLRAHDLAEQLVALADMEGDALRRALSRRASGTSLFYLGQFVEARRHLDEGIEIDDAAAAAGRGSPRLFLYGESAGVMCRLYSAWDLWFLGFPDRAVERVEAGLALARQLSHAHVLAFALSFAALIYLFRRDYGAALRPAEEAIKLATDHGFTQWRAMGTMCRGRARAGLGQHVDGIAEVCTGLADWERIGTRLATTQWLGLAADTYSKAGQVSEALVALERATETAAFTAEQYYEAELDRLRAELLLVLSDQAGAEEQLHKAVAVAQEQSAKSFELRATTSLARLWRDQGKRQQAHDLLAPVYGWFTEGFDTLDLKEAKALLEELKV